MEHYLKDFGVDKLETASVIGIYAGLVCPKSAQGVLWEGHVLKYCSWLQPGVLFAEEWRHLKKPQDEARNFEEDSRRAQ